MLKGHYHGDFDDVFCSKLYKYRDLLLISLGPLYNFVRDFRWAYKRRGLYPRGLIIGIKEPFRNEL